LLLEDVDERWSAENTITTTIRAIDIFDAVILTLRGRTGETVITDGMNRNSANQQSLGASSAPHLQFSNYTLLCRCQLRKPWRFPCAHLRFIS
jgi:hypothetical protein